MKTAVAPAELIKTKAAAFRESTPIIQQVQALVVDDDVSYQAADHLRATLKAGIKKWTDRLELIIRPAYDALEGLYALRREIVNPMTQSVAVLDGRMKDYKLLESRRIREEREQAERAEEELRRKQEETQRKLDAAKSKPMVKLLEKQLETIAEKVETAHEQVSAPVAGKSSSTRMVKVWEVTDLKKLLAAIVAGKIPEDVVEVNRGVMQDYFRGDTTPNKDAIRTWPGVTVKDDIVIASRR